MATKKTYRVTGAKFVWTATTPHIDLPLDIPVGVLRKLRALTDEGGDDMAVFFTMVDAVATIGTKNNIDKLGTLEFSRLMNAWFDEFGKAMAKQTGSPGK